ncbi:MAG: glycoside hydrolase family 2 TIM barrel-domain containing protein [Lachnospiraceae bacterium]|nr:glycoside hydrolase family 2 TIM barrel-domain containing protein [Lachnospiraceae bacterium]
MDWSQVKTAFPHRRRKNPETQNQLMTEWGRKVKQEAGSAPRVLMEYPRPQMVRLKPAGRYEILNGWWKYAVMDSRRVPQKWDGQILVPFSPETELSCVKRQIQPNEYLWYEREIDEKELPENQRVLMHFGAVDQRCEVYLNGKRMAVHSGGYLPFTVEVTGRLKQGKNILHLCVQDVSDTSFLTRGKQKLEQGGMFYTAQSGIWQTVWLEWVPMNYVEQMWITPLYDDNMFDIRLCINGPACDRQAGICSTAKEMIELKLYEPIIELSEQADGACCFCNAGRTLLRELQVEMESVQLDAVRRECHVKILIPDKKSWTPETPWLYGLGITTGEDHLAAYAAMRCFTVEKDEEGISRLCLNHKVYFMDGVLDQGYWPESLMTPPADAAMISDIIKMKEMGFNMLRKHCKIEPDRWYYHCDRLGMLVWQDMVNGGSSYNMMKLCYLPTLIPFLFARRKDQGNKNYHKTGRGQRESRRIWNEEAHETVDLLYNHPSVAAWVLFNEGWGQFEARKACKEIKEQDATRFVDHASGWFDQKQGDMRSVHNYFRKLKVEKGERPFVISEYGGYAFKEKEHIWTEKLYGYGVYKKPEKLQQAYNDLKKQIKLLVGEGLCAAVYTQVSDIEEEVNGILTYDRAVWKIPPVHHESEKNRIMEAKK